MKQIKWISVEDKLPEKPGLYIVHCLSDKETPVKTAHKWDKGPFAWAAGNVTHWMPLPEPPQESEE